VIVIDTSALFAIAVAEPERSEFIDLIDARGPALCSAVTYLETVMVLTGRSRQVEKQRIDDLLNVFTIDIVPIDRAIAEAAVDAFDRFGKGRHRARLNLADCFSYALAKSRDLPLLFKGQDFANTDIAPAWSG
jgi:ribonuclease VapC